MKKILNRTNLLVALLFAFIACLTGATTLSLTAHAQEEEPKSTVEFTSYTSVLNVGEMYTFAAQATMPDGTVTNALTWTSSDVAIITMTNNLAIAVAEGTATITATATDGAYASIDVLVSNSAIRVESVTVSPESLELGVGWHTRVYASVLPTDAYDQGVHFASSDTSIITVTDDGYVTAVAGK